MHDQLALAGHRMFIGSLFSGSEERAPTRLRAHLESLDDAQYDAQLAPRERERQCSPQS